MIKKLWVKFNHMDVVCFCEEGDRKCRNDKECKEYVVKFTEIKRVERDKKFDKLEKELARDGRLIENVAKNLTRQTNELKKSIKKFKI